LVWAPDQCLSAIPKAYHDYASSYSAEAEGFMHGCNKKQQQPFAELFLSRGKGLLLF